MRAVDAAASRVGIVRLQRFGLLDSQPSRTCRRRPAMGTVVDRGCEAGRHRHARMDAYAAAWLTPGSPLEGALLTGESGSRQHVRARGAQSRKASSSATGTPKHRIGAAGSNRRIRPFRRRSVAQVSTRNAQRTPSGEWGEFRLCDGANDWPRCLASSSAPRAILALGFGAQAQAPPTCGARFGPSAGMVVAAESRSILSAGPDGLGGSMRASPTIGR